MTSIWAFRRRWRDASQVELTELFVLLGEFALALEDPHLDGGLVVRRGGEDLAFFRWNRRVLLDEALEEAAFDLDTERERRDVEQDDVVDFAAENATLDRRAECDGLVGVDVLLGFFPGQFLDFLCDLGIRVDPPTSNTSSMSSLE